MRGHIRAATYANAAVAVTATLAAFVVWQLRQRLLRTIKSQEQRLAALESRLTSLPSSSLSAAARRPLLHLERPSPAAVMPTVRPEKKIEASTRLEMAQEEAAIVTTMPGSTWEESPFSNLPDEAVVRVLEYLPDMALLRCERVCWHWRVLVSILPQMWPAWRRCPAVLSERALDIPGMPTYGFGATPTDLPAETRALAERATARAIGTPSHELEIGICGTAWTVLHCGGGRAVPAALKQHQSRDFLLCGCVASGLVYSGDKEGQLRVWDACSGELLSRVAFSGGSVCALAASDGCLHVGDSSGRALLHDGTIRRTTAQPARDPGTTPRIQSPPRGVPPKTLSWCSRSRARVLVWRADLWVLSASALLQGQFEGYSFRAHEGKVSSLHAHPYSPDFLSGGADGAVRLWSRASLAHQAAQIRMPSSAVDGLEGTACPASTHQGRDDDGVTSAMADAPRRARAGVASEPSGPRTRQSDAHAHCGGGGRRTMDLGLWPIAHSTAMARHMDTVMILSRDECCAYSGSREGTVLASFLHSGQLALRIPRCGQLNVLAAHRGKLLICSDDGQHATLTLWDVPARVRVQEVGGIRKWNAPTCAAPS